MAAGRLYLFLDDFVLWRPNPVKNDARKRQKLWDSWGESLYRSEAVFVSEYLLIKKLPPCLSREIVFRAFPELQFPMHVDERRDRTKIVESNAGVVVRETDAEIQKMQSEIESAEQNLNILYFRLRELKERRRAVLSQREAGLR